MLNKRFVIHFGDGQAAFAVQMSNTFDPVAVAKTLGFRQPRPTIYVTGGASAMSPEDMAATRSIVERGLARFAEDRGAIVIDGATQAGIPVLLGEARHKYKYRFPLVGITPLELVNYPGHDNHNSETNELNPYHSHFVLTAGESFGAESEMITQITYTLSGEGQHPAIGVLINGGKIARDEVYARTTSDSISFPLVVIEGTGRFADILARALYAGHAEDQQVQDIIRKGRLQMVSINDGPEEMYIKLGKIFDAYQPPAATRA